MLVTEAEIWIFPAKLVSGNYSTSNPRAGLTAVASAGLWKTETKQKPDRVCGNAGPWLWSRFGSVRSQAEKHRQEDVGGEVRGAEALLGMRLPVRASQQHGAIRCVLQNCHAGTNFRVEESSS